MLALVLRCEAVTTASTFDAVLGHHLSATAGVPAAMQPAFVGVVIMAQMHSPAVYMVWPLVWPLLHHLACTAAALPLCSTSSGVCGEVLASLSPP
jgi:hypothetical protein